MSNLHEYTPQLYDGVVEMDAILNAEDTQFAVLEQNVKDVQDNQYVVTATEAGIKMFEAMLGIKADASVETLEFRRARIINRLSMSVPFSYRFLEDKLNDIIGVGQWEMRLNYSTYTLVIESSAVNQQWYHEIAITVNNVKPANIVFINEPLLSHNINVGEEISLTEATYNYRLGVSWFLGKDPFSSMVSKGVIKVPTTPSVKAAMLEDLAENVVTDINNVFLNDTYLITVFTTKSNDSNIVTVEYEVDATTSGLTTVTNVKLRSSANEVLFESAVYVPLVDLIIMKHTIKVKEGA